MLRHDGHGSPAYQQGVAFSNSAPTSYNVTSSPFYDAGVFLSPESLTTIDEYAANPQFLGLQEELRSILFTGVASLASSRRATPEPLETSNLVERTPIVQRLNLGGSSIPTKRLIMYLKNWATECAPWLDMFDESRQFGIQVPIIAQNSPALLYSMLALSARQIERKRGIQGSHDSLQLYQESIGLLTPILQAKDPNVLVTVCILCCLEMMSVSPRDWKRHIDGCAALFDSYDVNGFSGGLLQGVFWCYARMDLCAAIISDGAERTVLPIQKWVSMSHGICSSKEQEEEMIKAAFLQKSSEVPDMHANWAVYLSAKACDLVYRRTRYLELDEEDNYDSRPFDVQWHRLWDELQCWAANRGSAMLPIDTIGAKEEQQLFPEIFFSHWAAISGNQLYHTTCILMLEIRSSEISMELSLSEYSAVWHARRICGISMTNPHRGCLNNAIQTLYVAGKLLSHRSEHLAIARLIKNIEMTTGWGTMWRLKDLERVWGYTPGEMSNAV